MPFTSAQIDVSCDGDPIEGAPEAIHEAIQHAVHEVAQAALSRVHSVLNRQIKHPTPYYETQIIREDHPMMTVVHDRGIVYGPWLEGISVRNESTTFRGYHAFELGTEHAATEAPRITRTIVDAAVRAL